MTGETPRDTTSVRGTTLLTLAAISVAFAAADTYVVVLAIPEMMGSVGIPIDQLQRAAPIISGFLLGYVAMLPLIGRVADLRGRLPVLTFSLALFAVGSLLTAVAYDLPSMVGGRFLQGVGGGGLVPATLALVADLYPPHKRGMPLGLVSAVQEIGSVLGPLFGAAVLAFADWRAIFLINVGVGAVLAVAMWSLRDRSGATAPVSAAPDWLGAALAVVATASVTALLARPGFLLRDLTWGALFVSFAGNSRWLTPIGIIALAAIVAFGLRCLTAARPLLDLRDWARSLLDADLVGSLLLAAALAGVILAFATADPKVEVFAPAGLWCLLGSAIATIGFVVHQRQARSPLIPHGSLGARPAWGAMVVSFFVGAALIAALIDIPIFARTTTYHDSQFLAALVLVRFLVALPVGAIVGGYLLRALPAGVIAAAGMTLASMGFVMMARWEIDALTQLGSTVTLVIGGFGFGLALAPVNAAVLAATDHAVHGLASAFVVVARMVGMLVGISALTTLGLRSFYAEQKAIPPMDQVCDGTSRCAEYARLLIEAGIAQEQAVFAGAAACAAAAALLSLVVFRGLDSSGITTAEALGSSG